MLLVATLAILIVTSPAFSQDSRAWSFLGRNNAQEKFFFSIRTIQVSKAKVSIWIRIFSPKALPQSPPRAYGDGIKGYDVSEFWGPEEERYPAGSDYREMQLVIFPDRTFKKFSSDSSSWSARIPIAPESITEHLWEQFFIKHARVPEKF